MLKRAKKEKLLPQVIAIMSAYVTNLPNVQMPAMIKELDSVLLADGKK